MTELLRGFRTPSAEYCAQGGHAQFWPKNIKFAIQGQNQENGCSTSSYRCPEYEDVSLFEIGQKYEPKRMPIYIFAHNLAKYQYFSRKLALND